MFTDIGILITRNIQNNYFSFIFFPAQSKSAWNFLLLTKVSTRLIFLPGKTPKEKIIVFLMPQKMTTDRKNHSHHYKINIFFCSV